MDDEIEKLLELISRCNSVEQLWGLIGNSRLVGWDLKLVGHKFFHSPSGSNHTSTLVLLYIGMTESGRELRALVCEYGNRQLLDMAHEILRSLDPDVRVGLVDVLEVIFKRLKRIESRLK